MDSLDEDKVPIVDFDETAQKGTLIGEAHAKAFIRGDQPEGPDGLLMEGPYYCCELGCHVTHPFLLRKGNRFDLYGEGPAGPVFVTLSRTQAFCMAGLDEFGRCACNHETPFKS